MFRFLVIITLLLSTFSGVAQSYDPASCYGGRVEFMRFLKEEMVYPAKALEQGRQGVVTMFCIVNANGTTRDIRVFKGVSPEIDAEATRIFKKVLWEAAIQDGVNRASEVILDIPFNIRRWKRWCRKRGYVELPHPQQPVATTIKVYNARAVDKPPRADLPPLCYSLNQYLGDNVVYPQAAIRLNIEGTARVSFVIEPTGKLSNLHPEYYLGGGCTEEIMKVIRSLQWEPGIHNDEVVRTQMEIKFRFKLPEVQNARISSASPQNAVN